MDNVIAAFKKGLNTLLVGDFKQLLIFLILLFFFHPHYLGAEYINIWQLFFTGVVFASIFNCHHQPVVKTIALSLGIVTFILNWLTLFLDNEFFFVASEIGSCIFLSFASIALLSRILLAKVNADVLRGTICVYFMIGFVFAFAYTVIEFLIPGSFKGLTEGTVISSHGQYHFELTYFSFITILAIGFGDITPASNVIQMLVVTEGIIGQFYLAVIVARLVGVYTFRELKSKYTEKT